MYTKTNTKLYATDYIFFKSNFVRPVAAFWLSNLYKIYFLWGDCEQSMFSQNVRYFFCKIYENSKRKSPSSTRGSLTLATNFNLILTFMTQILMGSCVVRCAFSLASSKYDCSERVLRTSISIKK